MRSLEEKFQLSQKPVQETVRSIKTHIDYVLAGGPQPYSLYTFWTDIDKQGATLIVPAFRQPNPRGWQKRAAALADTNRTVTERPTIKPDDGHAFFYVERWNKCVVRDTDLGENYTAAAVLERSGIQKSIRQMINENYFKLSTAQKTILRSDYPDAAETRRHILLLSPWQSGIVQKQLELKEEQELAQRQSHRMRHSL